MKKSLEKFLVEDWVVTFISVPLLILAGFAYYLPTITIPSELHSLSAWGNMAALFIIALVTLFAGNKMLSRPMKGLLLSFIVVFFIAALALWIAKIPVVKYF